jgi:Ca2+-binding RTX toxin-like protein
MLFVEPVESRRLLAASIDLIGTTLLIRGAEVRANTIVVASNSDGIHLDVSVNYTPAVGDPQTLTQQVTLAEVAMIKVRGGRQNDTITIGTDQSEISINARVNGLGGSDTITTSAGNDRIAAGSGADVVNAGAGNDLVFGERGNDSLNGGLGDDSLWGGIGEDSIQGGAGADVLGGLLGTNVLTGGNDADKFYIKPGKKSQATDFTEGVDSFRILGKQSTDGAAPPPTA